MLFCAWRTEQSGAAACVKGPGTGHTQCTGGRRARTCCAPAAVSRGLTGALSGTPPPLRQPLPAAAAASRGRYFLTVMSWCPTYTVPSDVTCKVEQGGGQVGRGWVRGSRRARQPCGTTRMRCGQMVQHGKCSRHMVQHRGERSCSKSSKWRGLPHTHACTTTTSGWASARRARVRAHAHSLTHRRTHTPHTTQHTPAWIGWRRCRSSS